LLRSGLALAGANQLRSDNDDGILTALEVAGLDLTGTELVFLSACDTGVGGLKIGEGVYGLRRALVLAGVQTQVVSLWRVEDVSTAELVADYYRRLIAGEGRSMALRAAQ
jgi:CHAT domain-containing protein